MNNLKKIILIFLICIIPIILSITISIKNKINLKKKNNTLPKYYKNEKKREYEKYQKENKNIPLNKIIIDVNIGLNNKYYTHTSPSKNLNKPYILVNKYNYLTKDYIPQNLEEIKKEYALKGMKLVNYAKDAFEEMARNAKLENLNIIAMSSYRSYNYQLNLYNNYVQKDGRELADTYSARPGYSEHQTGLAIDIYNGTTDYNNFDQTKEFEWMNNNAYKYGFILRYPKNKEKETGYNYESWHYRYVTKAIATYIHKNKISLEEYYVTNIEK